VEGWAYSAKDEGALHECAARARSSDEDHEARNRPSWEDGTPTIILARSKPRRFGFDAPIGRLSKNHGVRPEWSSVPIDGPWRVLGGDPEGG